MVAAQIADNLKQRRGQNQKIRKSMHVCTGEKIYKPLDSEYGAMTSMMLFCNHCQKWVISVTMDFGYIYLPEDK
jgi:hypothetical protein